MSSKNCKNVICQLAATQCIQAAGAHQMSSFFRPEFSLNPLYQMSLRLFIQISPKEQVQPRENDFRSLQPQKTNCNFLVCSCTMKIHWICIRPVKIKSSFFDKSCHVFIKTYFQLLICLVNFPLLVLQLLISQCDDIQYTIGKYF